METRTKVLSVELDDADTVSIKLEKQVVLAGEVYSRQPHRTAVASDAVVRDQLVVVNQHLQAMEFPPITEDDLAKIEARVETLRSAKF